MNRALDEEFSNFYNCVHSVEFGPYFDVYCTAVLADDLLYATLSYQLLSP